MYVHFKHGFIEADAWDGSPIPDAFHQSQIDALKARRVVVVRSRRRATLAALALELERSSVVLHTPRWDYAYRLYVTGVEFGILLVSMARDLDYRNFKSWCGRNAPAQRQLAHDIWHTAHDAGTDE